MDRDNAGFDWAAPRLHFPVEATDLNSDVAEGMIAEAMVAGLTFGMKFPQAVRTARTPTCGGEVFETPMLARLVSAKQKLLLVAEIRLKSIWSERAQQIIEEELEAALLAGLRSASVPEDFDEPGGTGCGDAVRDLLAEHVSTFVTRLSSGGIAIEGGGAVLERDRHAADTSATTSGYSCRTGWVLDPELGRRRQWWTERVDGAISLGSRLQGSKRYDELLRFRIDELDVLIGMLEDLRTNRDGR